MYFNTVDPGGGETGQNKIKKHTHRKERPDDAGDGREGPALALAPEPEPDSTTARDWLVPLTWASIHRSILSIKIQIQKKIDLHEVQIYENNISA